MINENTTIREFLQLLGTESIRNQLHTNIWIAALFSDYKAAHPDYLHPYDFERYPNWIVTDCRFPNEAQAIKDRGGIMVRVKRIYQKEDWHPEGIITKQIPLHISETVLDSYEFDYTIYNDGTIEELTDKVKHLLTKHKII